jgi:hypothetical protein
LLCEDPNQLRVGRQRPHQRIDFCALLLRGQRYPSPWREASSGGKQARISSVGLTGAAGNLETVTEGALQVQLGAQATKTTSGHNSNPTTQGICLLHTVCRDDKAAFACLFGSDHRPDRPPCLWVCIQASDQTTIIVSLKQ